MARQDQRMPTDQPAEPPTRQPRKAAGGAVVHAWEVLRRTSAASGPGTARELRTGQKLWTGQVSGTARPAGLPVNRPVLSCSATAPGAPGELSFRHQWDGSPRAPVVGDAVSRSGRGRVSSAHRADCPAGQLPELTRHLSKTRPEQDRHPAGHLPGGPDALDAHRSATAGAGRSRHATTRPRQGPRSRQHRHRRSPPVVPDGPDARAPHVRRCRRPAAGCGST